MQVVVTKENASTAITFNDSVRITGRVALAEKGDLGKLGPVQVLLRSSGVAARRQRDRGAGRRGQLCLRPCAMGAHSGCQWYRRIRTPTSRSCGFNGLPLQVRTSSTRCPEPILMSSLDSGAASLTATFQEWRCQGDGPIAADRGIPSTATAARAIPLPAATSYAAHAGSSGPVFVAHPATFRRASTGCLWSRCSWTKTTNDPNVIAQRFRPRTEKITLARGEQKTIELQVK